MFSYIPYSDATFNPQSYGSRGRPTYGDQGYYNRNANAYNRGLASQLRQPVYNPYCNLDDDEDEACYSYPRRRATMIEARRREEVLQREKELQYARAIAEQKKIHEMQLQHEAKQREYERRILEESYGAPPCSRSRSHSRRSGDGE